MPAKQCNVMNRARVIVDENEAAASRISRNEGTSAARRLLASFQFLGVLYRPAPKFTVRL
jgi:hypothetical protein